MKLTLVILAATMGSRYGGLKQLDTFGAGNLSKAFTSLGFYYITN